MKSHRIPMRLRASVVAVHGALLALAGQAFAAEPSLVELTQPTSTVEVGVAKQSEFSAKSNEFTGIKSKEAFLFGHVDLRGGGAWDSADASRWRIEGTDLGTRSSSLEAEYGLQGRYRVRFGYDELRRNQSDSYQTPYLGIGTNTLLLPSNWIAVVVPRVSATAPNARGLSPAVTSSSAIVGGVLTAPTAAQTAAAAALQAADLPAFRRVDLFTQRARFDFGGDYQINSRWAVNATASHEHKNGLKPIGAQSRATGGDTSSILPTPINQDDDKFQFGASYTGDGLQVQASYEGQVFTNNVNGVTWNLWGAPTIQATMATPPSNLFHKLSLSGGYQFSPTTRFVGSFSRSRNTQNDPFIIDTSPFGTPLVPTPSANALVVSDSASLKLFNRLTPHLNLSAGYKYDLRENRTPVNIYGFYDNNNASTGTSPFAYLFPTLTGLGQNFNLNANTPYSKRVNQVVVDADYQIRPRQHLRAAWEGQKTDRYCIGSWIDCADAAKSTENTLKAEWRGNMSDAFSAKVSASAARRTVDYNEDAFLAVVPMAGQVPSTATGALAGTTAYSTLVALGLTGYGPVLGLTPAAPAGSALGFYFPLNNVLNNFLYANENRISELIGMRRYNQADRNRDKLRTSANWQATEALLFQGALDVNVDDYKKSVYGMQRVSQWAVNLDGTYALGDDMSFSVFTSLETQRSRFAGNTYTANSAATAVNGATAIDGGCFPTIALRNANNKIDPCLNWQMTLKDKTATLGATFTKSKLLGGKVSVQGSIVYSDGTTDIDVVGGNYVNNPYAGVAGNPTSATAAYFIPASALPTIKARSLDFRLSGTYQLRADSALRFAYGYQRLTSYDWGYEGLQDGGLTQVLPTREQAPHYSVHSIGISYVMSFR